LSQKWRYFNAYHIAYPLIYAYFSEKNDKNRGSKDEIVLDGLRQLLQPFWSMQSRSISGQIA
jgi:hypothetical protein